MSVRRTPARSATVDRILDAARQRVMDEGWDRFSLRGLARDVGFSPASLYEYFDGKEAILEAVAERARKRLVDRMREVPTDSTNRLVELSVAYVEFARRHREDFLLLFGRRRTEGEAPGKGSPYAIWLNQVAREFGSRSDAHEVAYGLWACAHGMAMLQITEFTGVEADFARSDRRALESFVSAMRT